MRSEVTQSLYVEVFGFDVDIVAAAGVRLILHSC